jgi:hypothetical protein
MIITGHIRQLITYEWSVQLVLLRSLILVDGSLQLTLLPNSPDYLIINLELACPVLQALYPSSSEYLAVGKEESAPSVL